VRVSAVTTRPLATQPSLCLVELHCGPGLTGLAVAPYDLSGGIQALANEQIVGEDVRAVTALWDAMIATSGARAVECAAALDVALWDLKAKLNDEPLWKALGGRRPRVNAHVASATLGANDHGFRGALADVTLNPAADAEHLQALRDALLTNTRTPTLAVRVSHPGEVEHVIECMRSLEEHFDLAWVENAAAAENSVGLKRISDSVRAAVCGGAQLLFPGEFVPHFRERALDIIKIDTARHGVTGAMRLADAAFGFELPVLLAASPGDFHAHLAGAMPYCMGIEVTPRSAALTGDVRIEGGWATAGDRAGHGVLA
jgi:L-alanine-DL-glutamate epimerase-like enolase superfamily enzyme